MAKMTTKGLIFLGWPSIGLHLYDSAIFCIASVTALFYIHKYTKTSD